MQTIKSWSNIKTASFIIHGNGESLPTSTNYINIARRVLAPLYMKRVMLQ